MILKSEGLVKHSITYCQVRGQIADFRLVFSEQSQEQAVIMQASITKCSSWWSCLTYCCHLAELRQALRQSGASVRGTQQRILQVGLSCYYSPLIDSLTYWIGRKSISEIREYYVQQHNTIADGAYSGNAYY